MLMMILKVFEGFMTLRFFGEHNKNENGKIYFSDELS